MSSEWMKVMLDEIARKKDEEAHARLELELRREEGDRAPEPPLDTPPGGGPPHGTPPGGGSLRGTPPDDSAAG